MSGPRVLIGVLAWRLHSETVRRIMAQRSAGPLDVLIMWGDDIRPYEDRFDAVTRKYQTLRERFLAGPYDALLTVEDDMLIPEDALERLLDVEADIAYGLYVWRYEGNHAWSAHPRVREEDGLLKFWPLSTMGEELPRKLWGQRLRVEGLGLGCTLIRRHVLARIPWRRPVVPDAHCNDTYFALDAQEHGFTQVCDLGVVCGHRTGDGRIVWPDPEAPDLIRFESEG